MILNSEQEGSRHGQRPKDHVEKLESGLTEVKMTLDGGVPKGSNIMICADFSHKCGLVHMRVDKDSSRQKKRSTTAA